GHAEEIRLQAAWTRRRPGQDGDFQRQHGAALRAAKAGRTDPARPLRRVEGRVSGEWRGSQQPALRLRRRTGLSLARWRSRTAALFCRRDCLAWLAMTPLIVIAGSTATKQSR